MPPLYDFRCYICGRIYPDLPEPPKQCQGCLRSRFFKVPAAPAIRFIGAGWSTPGKAPKQEE